MTSFWRSVLLTSCLARALIEFEYHHLGEQFFMSYRNIYIYFRHVIGIAVISILSLFVTVCRFLSLFVTVCSFL
jgi:hypothetical protein